MKIGKVQYVDFASGFAGIHDRIFVERKSLSHETEVRLVIQEFHSTGEISNPITMLSVRTMAVVLSHDAGQSVSTVVRLPTES